MIHHASALGGCLRSQVAAALGEKPIPVDDASQLRMNEGALHEEDVIARLTADGYAVTRQQDEVNLRPAGSDGGVVQGHLDGIVMTQPPDEGFPSSRVLEIKSMSDSAFKAFQAKGWYGDWPEASLPDRYRWQVSIYMLATGLEALLVAKNRNSGEITQHGIETPYYSLEQITERVAYLEDHIARRKYPETCPHSWFCDYKWMCAREEVSDAAASEPDERTLDSPILLAVAQRYAELGEAMKELQAPLAAQLKVLQAEQDEVKAELKLILPGMVEPNTAYRIGDYEVTWVESDVKASTRKYASVKRKGL